jgi:hypothetical protein
MREVYDESSRALSRASAFPEIRTNDSLNYGYEFKLNRHVDYLFLRVQSAPAPNRIPRNIGGWTSRFFRNWSH